MDRARPLRPGRRGLDFAEPHGFLLRAAAPGVAGAVARAAQEQVARFFLADGASVWDPDDGGPVFEVPAAELPERLRFADTE